MSNQKRKVYIETTIPSYLTALPSQDKTVADNQKITIEWWNVYRKSFDLFVSEFVVAEAGLGNPEAAKRRLTAIAEIPELATTNEMKILANQFLSKGIIPKKAELDAYHIAVAAMNGIDYLLTWNCTHLANIDMQSKISEICYNFCIEPPAICTPKELKDF